MTLFAPDGDLRDHSRAMTPIVMQRPQAAVADKVWPSVPISGDRVIDEWQIIDRWWTPHPTRTAYREVERGSSLRVDVSIDGSPWLVVERVRP